MALKSRSAMPVVRMGMLEMVVPAGMVKVTVWFAVHGVGVVLPDGQTLTLPKLTACAEAEVVADASAARKKRATNPTLMKRGGSWWRWELGIW